MDLLDLIRSKIDSLPDGPHLSGLRSVLRHIEAAYKHLNRGQTEGDESRPLQTPSIAQIKLLKVVSKRHIEYSKIKLQKR
jgi:hypothetical protein